MKQRLFIALTALTALLALALFATHPAVATEEPAEPQPAEPDVAIEEVVVPELSGEDDTGLQSIPDVTPAPEEKWEIVECTYRCDGQLQQWLCNRSDPYWCCNQIPCSGDLSDATCGNSYGTVHCY